jgi:hypothetical protein
MTSINSEAAESSQPAPGKMNGREHCPPDRFQLNLLGGEPLDGSGFEEEVPDTDFHWRD